MAAAGRNELHQHGFVPDWIKIKFLPFVNLCNLTNFFANEHRMIKIISILAYSQRFASLRGRPWRPCIIQASRLIRLRFLQGKVCNLNSKIALVYKKYRYAVINL